MRILKSIVRILTGILAGIGVFALLAMFLYQGEVEPIYNVDLSAHEMSRLVEDYTGAEFDGALCNNLLDRWYWVRENGTHAGFNEWADEYIIGQYTGIHELFVWKADSEQAAMKSWLDSPGHLVVLDSANKYCLYARGDTVVLIVDTE